MAERGAARLTTLPNLLGIARVAATPIVMVLLLVDGAGTDLAAAVLYLLAALSDIADGWIARRRDQVTPFGVFMDLAADKVLVAGVIIAMVQVDLVPAWIAATILVREFVVQAVRQLAAAEDVVISARALGKAKTLAINLGLFVLLLASDAATGGPMAGTSGLEPIGFWILVAGTALGVVSGLAYLRGAWPILVGRGATAPHDEARG
ncbi:MAG TPA: CDP-diacylglycerol--glycerol-3-phosphate 3-phosphatidyltransferase [Candidatus Limnocylindria bacterium]|nr:CDP-diacylglycerol--glycerol-3-phosphate 3-phosphatidyltransferase [Candidatus Limnocylindria bacterium]